MTPSASAGRLRFARAVLLVVAAGLATIQVQALARTLAPPAVYFKDFSQEYLLARALLDGVNTNLPIATLAERYATDTGFLDKANPTPHPPTAGLFGLPFALVPYVPSVSLWTVLQLVCLVAAIMLLIRAAGLTLRTPQMLLASFLVIAWPPVGLELGIAQLTLPLLAILAAAEVSLLRGRSKTGGLLLGTSLLLKPLAWPWLLVLLRRRDWPRARDRGRRGAPRLRHRGCARGRCAARRVFLPACCPRGTRATCTSRRTSRRRDSARRSWPTRRC